MIPFIFLAILLMLVSSMSYSQQTLRPHVINKYAVNSGGSGDFGKGWRSGWPTKKILGFRWYKKTSIMLETISFWQNISISIFKFSPFYHFFKIC